MENNLNESAIVVYVVQRWQNVIGVYRNYDDAIEIARQFIAKGHFCDVLAKPLN